MIIDKEMFRFIIVGIINTIFGTTIMFIMYNFLEFSYLISTVSNYFFGSILSFLLNKYYTFNNKERDFSQIIKFILNILVCYCISYWVPIYILSKYLNNLNISYNIFMILGMFLFVIFNYIGQRYFVFRNGE